MSAEDPGPNWASASPETISPVKMTSEERKAEKGKRERDEESGFQAASASYYDRKYNNNNVHGTACLYVRHAWIYAYRLICSSKAEIMYKYKVNGKSRCCF